MKMPLFSARAITAGLVLEDRRVVFGDILHRIGREEPDEALRHGVGLVAVGRIARETIESISGPVEKT